MCLVRPLLFQDVFQNILKRIEPFARLQFPCFPSRALRLICPRLGQASNRRFPGFALAHDQINICEPTNLCQDGKGSVLRRSAASTTLEAVKIVMLIYLSILSAAIVFATNWLALIPWRRARTGHWTERDRKSTRLNSSHVSESRMPSS